MKGSIIENQEVRNGAIGAFARITQYNESFFVGLQVGASYDDSNVHSQVRADGPIPAQHLNVSHHVDTDIVVDGLIRVGIESATFRPYVGGGISAMRAKSALNYSLINTADGSLAGQAQDSDEKWLLGYKLVTGVEIPVGDLGMVAHVEGFYADYEKGKFSHDSGTLGGGKKRTTVDPEQWGVRIGAAMEF